ncbi:MAG TPA: arsenate reductase ArsC [bacterium]|nr:arsenate reductase ArsC [bacterium]HPO51945.1 arsenate reductase ArsC [bacterium]HXK44946.1 arsenate reductase ArsC [bacterium]
MKQKKTRVIFISIQNDARSQIAEGFLKHLAGDEFEVFSAGTVPATELNPLAVTVMTEKGIDISRNTPKSMLHFIPHTGIFDYIITVCDENEDVKCPAFTDKTQKLHWNIKNPSSRFIGYDEQLDLMRKTRDQIYEKVKEFVKSVKYLKK